MIIVAVLRIILVASSHATFVVALSVFFSAGSMDGYFKNLTDLIVRVSARYQAPAIVISHSMGGPVMQSFFNVTSAAWKDKYVKAWFPVEGPWLGAAKVAKAIISGDNFGTPAPSDELVAAERSFESPLYLLPLPGLWPANHSNIIYVEKPNKVYTTSMFLDLMQDLKISDASTRLVPLFQKRQSLQAPGVRVYCIYGHGVDTPWGYKYNAFDGSNPAQTISGDGDGTVPLPSLTYCSQWSSRQTQPVVVKSFPGVEHVKAIMDQDIFKYIHTQMQALEATHL